MPSEKSTRRIPLLFLIGGAVLASTWSFLPSIADWLIAHSSPLPNRPITVRDEDRDDSGRRLAPLYLRATGDKRKGGEELRLVVRPDGLFAGETRIPNDEIRIVVNELLRSESKSDISLTSDRHVLYFQVIESLDTLRLTNARCIWLNTERMTPVVTAETTPR